LEQCIQKLFTDNGTKLTWAEGIRGLMGEKGSVEKDWNDSHNWRKMICEHILQRAK
jgi:hypothetical protein